jgi:hypothetical protein
MGKRKKQLGNITHRDGWIIRQALAFAIEGLGATKWPQLSNIEDMKEILAFMLDLDVTETEDGIVLPANWCQGEALIELGRLLKDTDPKAKARALAHLKARLKQVDEANAKEAA